MFSFINSTRFKSSEQTLQGRREEHPPIPASFSRSQDEARSSYLAIWRVKSALGGPFASVDIAAASSYNVQLEVESSLVVLPDFKSGVPG